MKTLLFLLASVMMSQAFAASCYDGKFEFQGAAGKAVVNFQIRSGPEGTTLSSMATNPNDTLTMGMVDDTFKDFKVIDIFRPDDGVKLVPMEGVKCPCDALKSEEGGFTLISEFTGDGKVRARMQYFDLSVKVTEIKACN